MSIRPKDSPMCTGFDNQGCWEKILNIKTLVEICKPMAAFKIITKENFIKWNLNTEYIFKLFIYGFIPFGNHKILCQILNSAHTT
jgi:hypothetical protein